MIAGRASVRPFGTGAVAGDVKTELLVSFDLLTSILPTPYVHAVRISSTHLIYVRGCNAAVVLFPPPASFNPPQPSELSKHDIRIPVNLNISTPHHSIGFSS